MKEENKTKKILFIGMGVVLVVIVTICFIVASKNVDLTSKSKKTVGEAASSISSEYDNINYGETTSVTNSEIVNITKGGSYSLAGDYEQVVVNTSEDVELILDNAEISCINGPAINIENAGSVSIVLTGTNKITATTTEDLDGAIYSKDDLILSGTGSLEIKSNYDGIVSKDTLVIKNGTYKIDSSDDGIRGKDNVAIVDGTFEITAGGDGIKSTNDQEAEKGYIAIDGGSYNITSKNDGIQAETGVTINGGTFTIVTTSTSSSDSAKGIKAGTLLEINGGTFNINSTDDGVHSNGDITINNGEFIITSKEDAFHADGLIEINDGTFEINAAEGLEATYVKINDGTLNINASDDGINAGRKSSEYSPTIEINGGSITIKMGQGDTDGIDSNGNIYINGGTVNVTATSPFDYDGTAQYNGGTMIVNGEETTTITNQMMGGKMFNGNMGGMNGNMGEAMNGGMRGGRKP